MEAALRHGRTDKSAMKSDHRAAAAAQPGTREMRAEDECGIAGLGITKQTRTFWDALGTLGSFRLKERLISELLSPVKINTRTGSSCSSASLITPTVALTLTNASALLGLLLSTNCNNEDFHFQ